MTIFRFVLNEVCLAVHISPDVSVFEYFIKPSSCVFYVPSFFSLLSLAYTQRHMVSGVVFICLFVVCFAVRVFLVRFVAQSSTNFASMPGGEGVSTGATPAILQNVPFPSKLEIKGNLASNWKRFRRVWSLAWY